MLIDLKAIMFYYYILLMKKLLTSLAAVAATIPAAAVAGCSPNPEWDRENMIVVSCAEGRVQRLGDIASGVRDAGAAHGLTFQETITQYVSDNLQRTLGQRALSEGTLLSVGIGGDHQPLAVYVGTCGNTLPGRDILPTTSPN